MQCATGLDIVSDTTKLLINNSLSTNTKSQYWSIFQAYKIFVTNAFPGAPYLPFILLHLLEFISFKYRSGWAYSTIRSAVSALSFIQNYLGFNDVCGNFLVQKSLLGVKKLRPSKDLRDPISFKMLIKMLDSVHLIINDTYTVCLIKSMFILAFRAFLRISEMTYDSNSSSVNHCLKLSDIRISVKDNLVEVIFRSFKHKTDDKPFSLAIKGDTSPYCPVRLLAQYLHMRKYNEGPLFLMKDRTPVNRKLFNNKLADVLNICGYNQKNLHIRSHSFRIGAATYAIAKGFTYEQVQVMGRWNSQAFKRYIRINSFTI